MPVIIFEVSNKTETKKCSYFSKTDKKSISYDFTSTNIDFDTIKYEMIECNRSCICKQENDKNSYDDYLEKIRFELENIHNDDTEDYDELNESNEHRINKIKEILNDNTIYKICEILNSYENNNNKITNIIEEIKPKLDLQKYPYNKRFEYDTDKKNIYMFTSNTNKC